MNSLTPPPHGPANICLLRNGVRGAGPRRCLLECQTCWRENKKKEAGDNLPLLLVLLPCHNGPSCALMVPASGGERGFLKSNLNPNPRVTS